jgi:hypothetical protein
MLMLFSFSAHPELNDFMKDGKPIGYMHAFNWHFVHTAVSPLALALLGVLLGRIQQEASVFGMKMTEAWNRLTPRMLAFWLAVSLIFAVGYSVNEWRSVLSGDCGGLFLGWPTYLCEAEGHDASRLAFMALAVLAQTCAVSVALAWLVVCVTSCWLFFGINGQLRYDRAQTKAIERLLRFTCAGWCTLLAGLYCVRLYSFHLYAIGSHGIDETLLAGLPWSLLEFRATTQSDWGSIFAAAIILVLVVAPFVLLRMRSPTPTLIKLPFGAIGFSVTSVVAMMWPRLGAFALSTAVILWALAWWRRQGRVGST